MSLGEGEGDGASVGDGGEVIAAPSSAAKTSPFRDAVIGEPVFGARANAGGSVAISTSTPTASTAFGAADQRPRKRLRTETISGCAGTFVRGLSLLGSIG